jgi:hypothetical protein
MAKVESLTVRDYLSTVKARVEGMTIMSSSCRCLMLEETRRELLVVY